VFGIEHIKRTSRRVKMLGALVVLAGLIFALHRTATPATIFGDGKVDVTIEERFLTKQMEGVKPPDLTFSSGHKRWAVTVERNGKHCVVVDGVQGPEYDDISWGAQFSPDGKHVAYVAKKGAKETAVIDGVEGKEYDLIGYGPYGEFIEDMACAAGTRQLALSNNSTNEDSGASGSRDLAFIEGGAHTAYPARRGDRWVIVTDGVESGEYDFLGWSREPPVRFPFGGWAFAARRADKWFVVAGGVEGEGYDEITRPSVADNGSVSHLAYGARSGDRWFAVYDGRKGRAYDDVCQVTLTESGDHLCYAARQGNRWFAVTDDMEGRPCEEVTVFDLAKQPSYALRLDGKWRMVTNGVEGRPYDEVGQLTWDPSGRRVAYVATEGNKSFVILDGVEGLPYDFVRSLTFGPDGKRFAYVAQTGKCQHMIVDGVDQPCGPEEAVSAPAFSGDGRRLAYRVNSSTGSLYRIVVDGVAGRWFVEGDDEPVFTGDGKHYAYTYPCVPYSRLERLCLSVNTILRHRLFRVEDDLWYIFVDGKEYRRHGYSLCLLRFTADDKHLLYRMERDRKEYLNVDGKEVRELPLCWRDPYEPDDTPPPTYDDDGSLRYITEKPDGYYLVTVTVVDRKARR